MNGLLTTIIPCCSPALLDSWECDPIHGQVTKKKQRVKPKPAGGFGSAWPQAREPTANATLKYKPRMWEDLILAS